MPYRLIMAIAMKALFQIIINQNDSHTEVNLKRGSYIPLIIDEGNYETEYNEN